MTSPLYFDDVHYIMSNADHELTSDVPSIMTIDHSTVLLAHGMIWISWRTASSSLARMLLCVTSVVALLCVTPMSICVTSSGYVIICTDNWLPTAGRVLLK